MSDYGRNAEVSGSLTVTGSSTFNQEGKDEDFRVESEDESHLIFAEGSTNRVSIGDNTGSPAATLEVKNNASAGAFGVPLVQLNNNDTDEIALDINASNIDANVVDINANAVTTAKVINVSADGLTTGNALYVADDSANTGTRNTALIIQNNDAAVAATALAVQSDGGITGVKVDKNFSDTTAATVTGLEIDFDKTGASTSNNTMYGVKVDMDNTTATDGANYMYGLHVTPTLTHAADAGDSLVFGAFINAQGATNGTGVAQAARFEAGGGDLNFGIVIDCEDGGTDLRIESSADNGDYFQIQTTTHGATTITTVDDDATAADLTFTIDGDILLDPVGGKVTVDGDLYLNQYIYHKGDTDTFINFTDDDINITVGGMNMVDFSEGGTDEITFNEAAQNLDVRIEGEAEPNLFFTDASHSRVGIGTNAPDCRLHVTGATGDIFKLENSTAYGVTYGQLVKTDLTITSAGATPIDTTLNLPAGAILDTLIVKLTTVGAVSSGTDYQLTNITLDNGIQAVTMFSASFTDFSLIGNGSSIVSGTMYYFNNIQPYYPGGGVGYLWTAGTNDIKLNFSDANVTTDAIMDVAAYYRKFDLVR